MKKNTKIINCIFAILTTIAFCLDYKKVYTNEVLDMKPFKGELLTCCLLCCVLILFYLKVENKKLHISKKIVSGIFTFFMIFGNSYNKYESWDLVIGSKRMIFVSIIASIGFYSFFKRIFIILDEALNKINLKKNKNEKTNKIIEFIDNKPFLCSLFIILICWSIYAIAFYPIILSPDPSFQIRQYFNVPTKYAKWVIQLDPNVYMTNHHPVVHTLLLGGCLSLGRLLVNDNFGLFIYSALQSLVLASVFSYSLVYLKKIKVSQKIRMIVLAIYALVPMFPLYGMSGVKDTYYTAFIILYIVFLYDFIRFRKDKKLSLGQAVYIFIILMLISLFRNNGLYVIVLSFPLIIIYSKKNRIRTSLVLLTFISCFMCYSKVILPYYKITDGSIREALSIPFQQTARYVRDHEEDLTKEDKAVIDKILEYDTLADRYDPEFADPVKNKFNKYTTDEDLKEYLGVWFRGLVKHPDTYVQATMNNVYGYFYPNDINWYIYTKYDTRITKDNLVDYHFNSFEGLRGKLAVIGAIFPYIPVVGLIANIGFNTWILIIMGIYLGTLRKKEYLIVLMPLYVSILICVASPVNTYFRYAMPYVFTMPILIPMFLNTIKGNKIEN